MSANFIRFVYKYNSWREKALAIKDLTPYELGCRNKCHASFQGLRIKSPRTGPSPLMSFPPASTPNCPLLKGKPDGFQPCKLSGSVVLPDILTPTLSSALIPPLEYQPSICYHFTNSSLGFGGFVFARCFKMDQKN